MNLLVGFRIFVFGIMNFLPIVTSQWSTIVLPEIIQFNLRINDPAKFSQIASYFYISYFTGMILGCFIWSNLVKLIAKRKCILFSIITMGLANMISGTGENVLFICFCRFIAGCSLNIHTVGKDFLFEFAEDKYRQFALSLDSCFGLLAHLAGPFIGMKIYYMNDRNFEISCLWIGGIFFIGAALFFIAFFLVSYQPVEHQAAEIVSLESIEEEKAPLKNSTGTENEIIEATGAKEVFLECLKNPNIRNAMIVFGISTACTNCDVVLSVIYLQTPWENGGLSISPNVLSKVSLISYIPALCILLSSSRICPRIISYKHFIRFFVVAFSLAVFMTPTFRDLIPGENHADYNIFIYINQMIKYSMNSHIFSPFIHYTINKRANKHIRTIINAINFIFSTTMIVIIMNLVVPLLSVTLFSPRYTSIEPFNKYITFGIITLLQGSCFFLIEKKNKGVALDKSNQQ
jgi:MFS family permease